jgi:HAD superfamily hydrolase (TIGR01509 family)
MLQAVIFDMDGLMVDSEPLAHQAWNDVLEPYGQRLDDVTYSQVIGLRLDATARLVQQTYELPVSPDHLAEAKENRLSQLRARGVPAMPGLRRLVGEIQARDLPWAVATSSPRATAEENLQQLGLLSLCQAIAGGDEASQGKPSPDIYLLAARRLAIMPQYCLALEDSVPGATAARSAGMITVAVPGEHGTFEQFAIADFVLSSLDIVADRLDELLAAGS